VKSYVYFSKYEQNHCPRGFEKEILALFLEYFYLPNT
jgi:hypothetical protein